MSRPAAPDAVAPAYGRIWTVGVLLLGGLTALIWLEPRWISRIQAAWFDAHQVVAPRPIESAPAVIVAIDEASLERLGQWPWPRTVLAQLIRDIERYRPAAIGIDILMPERDRLSPERLSALVRRQDPVLASRLAELPPTDAELARAIASAPVVLAVAGTPEPTGKALRAPPVIVFDSAKREKGDPTFASGINRYGGVLGSIDELDSAAKGHGLISVELTKGVVRRIPLVATIDGTPVPAMAIEMLRVASGVPSFRLYTVGPAVQAIAVGDLEFPVEADGAMRVYYSHRDARRYVSAIDVLDGKVDALQLERKLVLVATTSLGLGDLPSSALGERMPGSEVQAQLLENLYDRTWLSRPAWAPLVEIVLLAVLGLLLIWATPRSTPRNAALLAFGCVVILAAVAYAMFRSQRLLFDAATPGLALLALFGALLVVTLAEAIRRRKSLERLVQAQREQAAYIEGELEAARRIQTGILPRAELLRGDRRIDLAASMTPAHEVGGDLYDFFRLDDRRLFFLIGDVAGKGLSASIFMAVSKALYKSATLRGRDAKIGELMRTANDEVSRDNPEMFFVTAFAGVLDLESGELVYCNAGHENPYLLAPGHPPLVRLDGGGGPPLCAVEKFAYCDASCIIQPGQLLCLVTDGVLDAQNPAGERFGSQRLQDLLAHARNGELTARAVVDTVVGETNSFVNGAESADDMTVLALRWLGSGMARGDESAIRVVP